MDTSFAAWTERRCGAGILPVSGMAARATRRRACAAWRRPCVAALLSLGVSLGASPLAAAQDTPGASAEGLLALARTANPAFAAERYQTQAVRERVGAAGALPDPRFQVELMDVTNTMRGGNTALLPGEVGETRYRVVQPLPGWGKRALERDAARTAAARAEAGQDAAWRTLEAQVRAFWLRYWQADREARLNGAQQRLLKSVEESALARYRNGIGSQQEVLQAQRAHAAERLAALSIAQRREGAAAALNALLGRTPDAPLALPDDPPPLPAKLDFPSLVERVRQAHPEARAEAVGVEAARIERERTRRERQPDYAVGLTYNRPRGGQESWDLMFEVMIPLQQGVRDARERETAALSLAADARRLATETRLAGELGTAWSAWQSATDRLRLVRTSLLPQARAGRDAARAALAAGAPSSTDVFEAVLMTERQVLDTEFALLQAEAEARLALVEIGRLSGEIE